MGFKIAQMQPFTNHENEDEDFKQSNHFREAIITLRLGALVVHLNNDNTQGIESADEIQARLKKSINRHRLFSPEEKAQLHTYRLHRLQALENILEIKMELARLVLGKKRRVRHILLSIIFANGYYTRAKQQHLEKLYLTLGLNKRTLKDDINTFFPTKPVPQNKPKIINKTIAKNDAKPPLTVKNTPKKRIKSRPSAEKVTARYNQQSLTNKRINLYDHLIKKETYSKKEFNHLCQHYKLTSDGAIETINNWAYQQVGRPVIVTKENVIHMNTEIILKIQQKITTTSPKIHHSA